MSLSQQVLPEPQHSPLPWRLLPKRPGDKVLRITSPAVKDSFFALYAEVDCDDKDTDTAIANAAHIVRCVNSFDDLVAALKQFRDMLKLLADTATGENHSDPENCTGTNCSICRVAANAYALIKLHDREGGQP